MNENYKGGLILGFSNGLVGICLSHMLTSHNYTYVIKGVLSNRISKLINN